MAKGTQGSDVQLKLQPLDQSKYGERVKSSFDELGKCVSAWARKWMRNSRIGTTSIRTPGMDLLMKQIQQVKEKPKKDRRGKPLKSWER